MHGTVDDRVGLFQVDRAWPIHNFLTGALPGTKASSDVFSRESVLVTRTRKDVSVVTIRAGLHAESQL